MVIVFCGILILLVGISRLQHGVWSAPAAVYGVVWVVASLPAVVTLPDIVSPLAMGLVVSFVLAAMAGASVVSAAHGPVAPLRIVELEDFPIRSFDGLTALLLLLGIGGLGAAAYYVLSAGFALSEFGAIETWLQMALKNSIARYRGETEPFAVRLLLALNYAGAMLGGISFAQRCTRTVRVISLLPFIAALLITAFTTAKAPTMLSLLFGFAGWLAVKARGPAMRKPMRWRQRVGLVVVVGLLGLGLVGTMALRYGDGADGALIFSRVIGYVFGQMPGMSAWLAVEDWSGARPTFGAFTFAGIFEALGFLQREKGLYDPIGLNDWSAESNVFSALRGLITDFGLPCAWLAVAAFTGFAQHCWLRLRSGRGGAPAVFGLTTFNAFALWSPVVSIFAYNVIWLALAVCLLAMPLFKAYGKLGERTQQGAGFAG